MNLVTRTRDKVDERQVRVRLTSTGSALQAAAREIKRCILDASSLKSEEQRRLRQEIQALRDSLTRAAKPPRHSR